MFKNADNLTFGFDLQVFAEGDPAPAEPGPAEPTPAPAADPVPDSDPRTAMSLADYFTSRSQASESVTPTTTEPAPGTVEPGGTPNATPEPAKTEPQPPVIDVPDKFKNPDGSVNIEALAKSYVNMEQLYSKSQNPQQFEALHQTNQQLQELVATLKAQSEPKQPELTPEELEAAEEAENERLWDLMQTNPKAAIKELLQKELEPLRQNAETQEFYNRFEGHMSKVAEANPDNFNDLLPQVKVELNNMGDEVYAALEKAGKNPVEIAYNLAKAGQATPKPAEPAPKIPTVEEMLADPAIMAKIAQNPAIQAQILAQHKQAIKSEPAPTLVGTGANGLPPSTAPVDLTNTKKAKEALIAKYGGITLQ